MAEGDKTEDRKTPEQRQAEQIKSELRRDQYGTWILTLTTDTLDGAEALRDFQTINKDGKRVLASHTLESYHISGNRQVDLKITKIPDPRLPEATSKPAGRSPYDHGGRFGGSRGR